MKIKWHHAKRGQDIYTNLFWNDKCNSNICMYDKYKSSDEGDFVIPTEKFSTSTTIARNSRKKRKLRIIVNNIDLFSRYRGLSQYIVCLFIMTCYKFVCLLIALMFILESDAKGNIDNDNNFIRSLGRSHYDK